MDFGFFVAGFFVAGFFAAAFFATGFAGGLAGRFAAWAEGAAPEGLPIVDPGHVPSKSPRDVFAFIIHEGKVRAPAAAMALIERCS